MCLMCLSVRKVEGHARFDFGATAVHFQGANGGDQHDAVGDVAGLTTLDVEELFHANVGTKTSLSAGGRAGPQMEKT